MKNTTLIRNKKGAFSLVEMLVVIAVIGILAAIAVPNIGKINNAAEDSKNRRNAQQLSSVCNAAQAAGFDFVEAAGGTGVEAYKVAAQVVGGHTIDDASSPFKGAFFGVPNLSEQEYKLAANYLKNENGMLVYVYTKEEVKSE
jgi:type IV pilus assembly protein PilA